MVVEAISSVIDLNNIADAVKNKRDSYLQNRFNAFLSELEKSDRVLVSQTINNLSTEFRTAEFEQILYTSIERARSNFEAEAIAKCLIYSGKIVDPTVFLPMVAAIEKLLPGDLEPLAEGFKIHKRMKVEGLCYGVVHPEIVRLRKLFKRPGIRQRYFAAGLSVMSSEVGPGDIMLSNELPPHLIKALDLK